jgi:hypothetical protein
MKPANGQRHLILSIMLPARITSRQYSTHVDRRASA